MDGLSLAVGFYVHSPCGSGNLLMDVFFVGLLPEGCAGVLHKICCYADVVAISFPAKYFASLYQL